MGEWEDAVQQMNDAREAHAADPGNLELHDAHQQAQERVAELRAQQRQTAIDSGERVDGFGVVTEDHTGDQPENPEG